MPGWVPVTVGIAVVVAVIAAAAADGASIRKSISEAGATSELIFVAFSGTFSL